MLFSVNKVALIEPEKDEIDPDEINKEIELEKAKEEYEIRLKAEQLERERKKQEYIDKLNAEINDNLFEEKIIRLDRDDVDVSENEDIY